jgi:hypothetical protein
MTVIARRNDVAIQRYRLLHCVRNDDPIRYEELNNHILPYGKHFGDAKSIEHDETTVLDAF